MLARNYVSHTGVALVTILALSLRLHHIDYDSLFMDELRQVSYYPYSFLEIIHLAASQTQPPLDYWIGKIFFHFSNTDFALRLPAALFGTGTVFLLTNVCVKKYGLSIGLILGGYVAINHFHIYYSQEARPYSAAIFFFVALIILTDKIVNIDTPKKLHYAGISILSLSLLLTRTLTPLIIVSTLLTFTVIAAYSSRNSPKRSAKYRMVATLLVLTMAIYSPFFIYILDSNQRYLNNTTSFFTALKMGVGAVNFSNIHGTMTAQTGNMVIVFIALTSMAFVFSLTMPEEKKNGRPLLIMLAFIISILMIHIIVHHAKSPLPLRPPYAFYLLPLLTFSAGASLYYIRKVIKPYISVKIITLFFALLFIAPQSLSTYAFKSMKIRSDWRSLAEYTSLNFGRKHLLLFETLANYDHWNPSFYGFSRYPYGRSLPGDMEKLLLNVTNLEQYTLKPVIILFHYRNYFLTPTSTHGMMAIKSPDPTPIRFDHISGTIKSKNFVGFSVISLRNYSSNLRNDLAILVSAIITRSPSDSSTVKMRLLLESLSNNVYLDKSRTFQEIKKLARPSQYKLIEKTTQAAQPL